MRPHEFETFQKAIEQAKIQLLYRSRIVHSHHWQGADIRQKPEMATHEVKHLSFQVPMLHQNLTSYQAEIEPNLPWADDHFEERVCGRPINPGIQWAKWPYGNSAARFLDEHGKFNHNYMERYWPKYAGLPRDLPTLDVDDWNRKFEEQQDYPAEKIVPRGFGIKYGYGDLNDVVELLAKDPYTRQAYLPVWFPEDTGGGAKRAPCTLGYHFLMRDRRLDIDYHIRSCDFVRHFRDDIYLTVRLALWMLERCTALNPEWADVYPGQFVMHIGSLHCFRNDYMSLKK